MITVDYLIVLVMLTAGQASDPMSAEEKKTLVDTHNALRALEGASNMQFMVWNDYLESMAADWADGCSFHHGQPSRDEKTMPYNPVGQNLQAYSAKGLNLTASVLGWYNEKKYYDYETSRCSNSPCGHYTQVVWDTSRAIGCAWTYCDSLKKVSFESGTLLVCNYGPAGNYPRKPYIKGEACTNCPTGKGWCHKKLCNPDCTGPSSKCECKSACAVCGKLDKTFCACVCKNGWMGNDCGSKCKDLHQDCNANPGWPPSWCTKYSYVSDNCPKMCGKCKPDDGSCDAKEVTTTTTTTIKTTRVQIHADSNSSPPRIYILADILSLYCVAMSFLAL